MGFDAFIGVDLAWGERNRTGLAAVDPEGNLLDVVDRRTDDDIVAWLAAYAAGSALVAIDAPLIVTNPTGSRACEQQLTAIFGRYDAGTHPSNTAKPWFAAGTRGARIAHRAGLDIDPESPSSRRAIEVYPHPATVVLFDLDRTIKYKHKPGRALTELQAASVRLMALIESLASAHPPLRVHGTGDWDDISALVTTASHKSQLRAVEDRIDAVVCAYIAAYYAHRRHDTTTFGDGVSGYIVTPTLPPGHRPPHRSREQRQK